MKRIGPMDGLHTVRESTHKPSRSMLFQARCACGRQERMCALGERYEALTELYLVITNPVTNRERLR